MSDSSKPKETANIVRVNRAQVEELKIAAPRSERGRVRICAHPSNGDLLHEMVIALAKSTYIRPHKHHGKSESMHVIEGLASAVIFSDGGKIQEIIRLGPVGSGRDFFYRMASPLFHMLVIESDVLVVHETTNGPFRPADAEFAQWAPAETDMAACRAFVEKIAGLIESGGKQD